jgi:DnaJ-class molecular chaperone
MAFNALNTSNFFDEIQKAYKILDNLDDKQEYEAYLIHNLDLWFVKYEEELAEQLGQEPAYTEPLTEMPSGGALAGQTEVDTAPGLP